MDKDKFYTGFTWDEIKEITRVLRKCKKVDIHKIPNAGYDEAFFDFPAYGGLAKKIFNRFSSAQVDYLQDYLDSFNSIKINEVAHELARGW